MVSSVNRSPVQVPRSRPSTRLAPAARRPAPSRPANDMSVPTPDDIDALLSGLYGDDEPAPEPGAERGPVKIREFLSYRHPEDPRAHRGQVFNLIA